MPVDFLTSEQLQRYGQYPGEPTTEQLNGYFYLNDFDLTLVKQKRDATTRLGFALQLCTVRFLGTFLNDPLDLPAVVLEFVASQLNEDVPAELGAYQFSRTRWDHRQEIMQHYGYRDFSNKPHHWRLVRWLYTRTWLSSERQSILFDLATHWLAERKVLLPGATTLSRLVAQVSDRASQRLWTELADRLNASQVERLEGLLEIEEGSAFSTLKRLTNAPTRISSEALVTALKRVEAIRAVGIHDIDLSQLPANHLETLARYGLKTWAQTVKRMQPTRRAATLLVTVQALLLKAVDDVLDLFDEVVRDVLSDAKKKGKQERLHSLKDFDQASLRLALVCERLIDPTRPREDIDAFVFAGLNQDDVQQAITVVKSTARPPDDNYEAETLKKWRTVRTFLPKLLTVIRFEAAEGGKDVLAAWQYLETVLDTKKRTLVDPPLNSISPAWQRHVFTDKQTVERKAYALSTVQTLREALRRRDVFVAQSKRYSDPREKLLQGDNWLVARAKVSKSLNLPLEPESLLNKLSDQLDSAYRDVAGRLPGNSAIRVEHEQGKASLTITALEKLDEPHSLVTLRIRVAGMLPKLDLPELILEMHARTGMMNEFTHLSEQNASVKGFPTTVAAVLIAEACNIGLEALVSESLSALSSARLSWVQQNYVRLETIRKANARLVEAQSTIPLASAWGGGEVASADGLRFVVPVRTLNAGPNPKYFGVSRGLTYYNFDTDQFTEFHGIVIPGTLKDSLFILDGLLEHETSIAPKEVIADTGAYSDVVFGLFYLLGYQFSPRLADAGESRFWRLDNTADYGVLNGVARHQLSRKLVSQNWDDLLRVAGSLLQGPVTASDFMRTLQRGKNPSTLSRAIAELGRIAKTLYLLAYIDDEGYRRRILTQLNRHEARHALARAVFHGKRGEIRKRYREGQEDQLGALGLVVNAIVLWNTLYMNRALEQLRTEGFDVKPEDVARLSPLQFEHINFLGTYHFDLPEEQRQGQFRPLRSGV